MPAATLATLIQDRFGSDYLIQLTNSTSTATSLNSTVLLAACSDAIGEFERIVRITHDTGNASHIPILIQGALYFLELYKGRDSSIVQMHSKNFYAACKSFTSIMYASPSTTSNLTVTREKSGTTLDFDKNNPVWTSTPNILKETIE